MGYLTAFTGVYFGTLYRKNYHGLERIDYDLFIDYDPENKPCYSFMHKIFMGFGRCVLLILFLSPLYYIEKVFTENYYREGDYFIISMFLFTFMVFSYFEWVCITINLDINHFDLKSQ